MSLYKNTQKLAKKKNSLFKKILCFVTALMFLILTFSINVFASNNVILYNIYDSRNNNVVGYYSIHQIGGTSVYDLDTVYLTSSTFVTDLCSMYSDWYIGFGDYEIASDYLQNFLNNNLGLESNDFVTPSALVTSWVKGYIETIFVTGLNSEYVSLINYDSALVLQYDQGYNAGYSQGLRASDDAYLEAQYDSIYNIAYSEGYTSGTDATSKSAYLQGFNDGTEQGRGVSNFFWGFFTAPFIFMSNLFSFKLFGIDFYQIVLGILTAVIVIFVIRFIISKAG